MFAPRPRLPRFFPLGLLLVLPVSAHSATPAEEDPWQLMAALRQSESAEAFAALDTPSETDRLGQALSLLGAQPKTEANLARAERMLAELAAHASDPAVAVRAAFLHARVPHIHRQPTDWTEAARRYLAVYRAHPDQPLGQRALVRHGIVTLFRPLPPEDFATTFQSFVTLAADLTDPEARRDLDWLLLSVHERRLDDPASTLVHLERVLANPTPLRELTRISLLVQAGELARELGDHAKAARYYREFLDTARRDARVYFIRQRLAEVEAAS